MRKDKFCNSYRKSFMHKYEIVTVNYNNAEYSKTLIDNIKQIRLDNLFDLRLTIVDNNSEKIDFDNLHEFSKSFDWVKIIRSDTNLGYFRGLNKGIEKANVKQGLLVCNNDVIFEMNFFTKLSALNDVEAMVICPKVIAKNGRMQNPHCISKFSKLRLFSHDLYYSNYYLGMIFYKLSSLFKFFSKYNLDDDKLQQRQKIHMGVGACYYLLPKFFEKYSLLDGRVFLWGEEALLAGQVELAGGFSMYEPTLVVHHAENVSVAKIPSKKAYQISKQSYSIYRQYL